MGAEEEASRRMEVEEESAPSGTGVQAALESALAHCEDEVDVAAAHTARAEAAADLAEFDESIPLEEQPQPEKELSKAEMEVQALMQQVSLFYLSIKYIAYLHIHRYLQPVANNLHPV